MADDLILLFISSALLSALLVWVALKFAQSRGVLALPGDRQSHDVPTATGGGIGLVGAVVLTSLALPELRHSAVWILGVIPGISLLALIGWMDDRRPLPNMTRLIVQVVVSIGLLWSLPGPGVGWLEGLIGGLAMVWTMNAYNFMDGSHGMAGYQGVFSALLLCMLLSGAGAADHLALAAAVTAGACAGFIPFNSPVARIFMGDSGSVPLGFIFAAILVAGIDANLLSIPEAAMVLAVFLTDSVLTLIKRVIAGERWYTAHKQHVYQRLIAHGWSHGRVLLLYQALNLVLVAPAVMLARMYPELAWVIAGLMFLLLSTGWYIASLKFRVRY